MLKTNAHWRAENPIIFISLHFCLGIFISILLNDYSITKQRILFSLIISLTLLLLIRKPNLIVNGVLIFWGILLGVISKQGWAIPMDILKEHTESISAPLMQKMDWAIANKEASSFAKSLLLGYKSDINKELFNAYKQLGLLHIIAISGMHLDIIFKKLHLSIQSITQNRSIQFLFLFLILCLVGVYTIMTGASPSVVRAALFFSLFALGKFLSAPIYTLNLIAGGLLCVLILDWPSLTSVGLQLSYGAIFGIYIWYRYLYKTITISNPLLVFIWSNICMSLAAQIGTLPIIAFHFHQISSIVLISNCVVVPISNLLLYGLVILICLPNQFYMVHFLGKIIEKYIIIMNQGILAYVKKFPIGQAAVFMDQWDLVFYFMAMFWLYWWLTRLKNVNLIYLLGTIVLWTIKKLFS
jgi:competence protein ComEC